MTDEIEGGLPEPVDDVVYNRVSDGAVLLSTDGEIYYGLNETGALVWERLGDCDTLDALCRELEGEYPDVGRDELRRDVGELLEELVDHGLLRREGGGDGERSPPGAGGG